MRILLLLLLSFNAFSQSAFTDVYFPKVNEAELLICDGKYSEASQIYEEAFAAVKTPLAKDIYNNLICSMLSGQLESAKKMLLKLAKLGKSPEFISSKEIFKQTQNAIFWQNFRPIYEQISTMAEPSIKPDALVEFYKLEKSMGVLGEKKQMHPYQLPDNYNVTVYPKVEETMISFPNNYNFNYNDSLNKGKSSSYKDSVIMEVKRQMRTKIEEFEKVRISANIQFYNQIQIILKEEGILSEDSDFIGGIDDWDSPFRKKLKEYLITSSRSDSKYFIKNTEPILINALKEGIISPETAISIGVEQNEYRGYRPTIIKVVIEDNVDCSIAGISKSTDFNYYKKQELSNEDNNLYKALREKFGLPSLEDRIKKSIFMSTKNEHFYFYESSTLESTTVPSCEMAEKMLEGAIIIEP